MINAMRILVCVALVFTSTVSSNDRSKRDYLVNYNGPWQYQNWNGPFTGNENIVPIGASQLRTDTKFIRQEINRPRNLNSEWSNREPSLEGSIPNYQVRGSIYENQRRPHLSNYVRNIEKVARSQNAFGSTERSEHQDESSNQSENPGSLGRSEGLNRTPGLLGSYKGISQFRSRNQEENGRIQLNQQKIRYNVQGGLSRDSQRATSSEENDGASENAARVSDLGGPIRFGGAKEQNGWSHLNQLNDGFNAQLWRSGRSWDEPRIGGSINDGPSRLRGGEQGQNEESQSDQTGNRYVWKAGRAGNGVEDGRINSGISWSNQGIWRGKSLNRNRLGASRLAAQEPRSNTDSEEAQLQNSRSKQQGTNQGLPNKYSYGELNAKILQVIRSNPSMISNLEELAGQLQGDQIPANQQARELKRLLQESRKIERSSQRRGLNVRPNSLLENFFQIVNADGI